MSCAIGSMKASRSYDRQAVMIEPKRDGEGKDDAKYLPHRRTWSSYRGFTAIKSSIKSLASGSTASVMI